MAFRNLIESIPAYQQPLAEERAAAQRGTRAWTATIENFAQMYPELASLVPQARQWAAQKFAEGYRGEGMHGLRYINEPGRGSIKTRGQGFGSSDDMALDYLIQQAAQSKVARPPGRMAADGGLLGAVAMDRDGRDPLGTAQSFDDYIAENQTDAARAEEWRKANVKKRTQRNLLYGVGLAGTLAAAIGAGTAGAGAAGAGGGGGIGSGLSTAGATTTGAGAATGAGLTGLAAAGAGAAPIGLQNFASDFLAPMEGASNVAGTSAYQALNAAGGVPLSIGGNVAGVSTMPGAGEPFSGGRMLTDYGGGGGIGGGLETAGATTTGAGTATNALTGLEAAGTGMAGMGTGAAGTATGLLGDYEYLAPLLGLISPGGGGGAGAGGDSTMGPVGGGTGLGTDYTQGLESSLSALDFFRKRQLDADIQRLKTSMLQRGIMGSGIERDALTKLMSESAGQTEAAAQGAAIDWARLSQANAAQQYDWSQRVGLTREGVANQASQANQDARARAWQLILSTPGLANRIRGFFS